MRAEIKKQNGNGFFNGLFILHLVKLLNALLITGVFAVFWYAFLAHTLYAPFFRRGNWVILILYLFLYIYFGKVNWAFLVSYYRVYEMVVNQMIAALFTNVIFYVITWLLKKHLPNVGVFLLVFLCQIVISVIWSALTQAWYFRHFPPKKTAIVWDMRRGLDSLIAQNGLSKKFNIVATPSATECVEDLSLLDGMETVFLTGVHSHNRNVIIKYCVSHGITAFIIPRIGDTLMSAACPIHMCYLPFLRLGRYAPSPEYLAIKRAGDILVSALVLLITSPILIVIACIIHFQDGGSVFYKQTRLTKNGRKFEIIKFRSMRMDAEKDGVARLSTKKDDRITPIGRFIRATRIDEIPQLINVLKGEMSLVGPRPERPEIHRKYCEELPDFDLRLQAKAGITGYAQIHGKYNTTPYDKLQMDLMYLAKPGIIEDINILFTTLKVLILPESTEGIEAGNVTAMDSNQNEREGE